MRSRAAVADGAAFVGVGGAENVDDFLCRFGEEDLGAGGEEVVEAVPAVADHGGAAGGGLEEAHAGRPASGDHVGAGGVELPSASPCEVVVTKQGC
jgi:hypothetical protein